MSRDTLYSNINTSFNKQQNPLRTFELPCDKEYVQMPIGACSYFLLSEYPADVEVFVSLNPNRKDAFKVDNRNTGFKINEVYTPEGVPSFVKDVYVWTEGITNLHDNNGKPASVKIVTSSLPSFEILNNSSINSIESIGQIGSINGLVGYPQGAIAITGMISPAYKGEYKISSDFIWQEWETTKSEILTIPNIDPRRQYIVSGKAILDPELVVPVPAAWTTKVLGSVNIHTHAGIVLRQDSPLRQTPDGIMSLYGISFSLGEYHTAGGATTKTYGGGVLNNDMSLQVSGQFILDNFLQDDGSIAVEVHIRQIGQQQNDTAERNWTNTKSTYQISAYRKD